jgi:hypothetical protein
VLNEYLEGKYLTDFEWVHEKKEEEEIERETRERQRERW